MPVGNHAGPPIIVATGQVILQEDTATILDSRIRQGDLLHWCYNGASGVSLNMAAIGGFVDGDGVAFIVDGSASGAFDDTSWNWMVTRDPNYVP